MTPDQIYNKLIELNDISIPDDAGKRSFDYLFEIVSKIRSAQDFCSRYLVDCNKKVTEAKRIVTARRREIDDYKIQAIKEQRYLDQIKSFPERKQLIELEAAQKIDLSGAEQQLEALVNLKSSLQDTLTNLRTAKEELNMVVGLLKQEFKDANAGALWNNPMPVPSEDPLADLPDFQEG